MACRPRHVLHQAQPWVAVPIAYKVLSLVFMRWLTRWSISLIECLHSFDLNRWRTVIQLTANAKPLILNSCSRRQSQSFILWIFFTSQLYAVDCWTSCCDISGYKFPQFRAKGCITLKMAGGSMVKVTKWKGVVDLYRLRPIYLEEVRQCGPSHQFRQSREELVDSFVSVPWYFYTTHFCLLASINLHFEEAWMFSFMFSCTQCQTEQTKPFGKLLLTRDLPSYPFNSSIHFHKSNSITNLLNLAKYVVDLEQKWN